MRPRSRPRTPSNTLIWSDEHLQPARHAQPADAGRHDPLASARRRSDGHQPVGRGVVHPSGTRGARAAGTRRRRGARLAAGARAPLVVAAQRRGAVHPRGRHRPAVRGLLPATRPMPPRPSSYVVPDPVVATEYYWRVKASLGSGVVTQWSPRPQLHHRRPGQAGASTARRQLRHPTLVGRGARLGACDGREDLQPPDQHRPELQHDRAPAVLRS